MVSTIVFLFPSVICGIFLRYRIQQVRCYLHISKSDKIVFDRVKTKDINTSIPDNTFIDNGCMKRKMISIDNGYSLLFQSQGIIRFFSCI